MPPPPERSTGNASGDLLEARRLLQAGLAELGLEWGKGEMAGRRVSERPARAKPPSRRSRKTLKD